MSKNFQVDGNKGSCVQNFQAQQGVGRVGSIADRSQLVLPRHQQLWWRVVAGWIGLRCSSWRGQCCAGRWRLCELLGARGLVCDESEEAQLV